MPRKRTFILAGIALGAILSSNACDGGGTEPPPPDPPRPTTVTITPSAAELAALEATVRLTAEVRDQYGDVMAGASVSWSSSDVAVAAVDAAGLVTAAGNGAATITATSGQASGTAAVTVAQVVAAVTVTPGADTLVALGDTVRLTAEGRDANGHVVEGAEFAWASDRESVAAVSAAGVVTAAGNGAATITATSGQASGTAAVTVAQVVAAVTVTPGADTLVALGDTVRLAAEGRDANGHVVAGAEFAWASDRESVAAVSAAGVVTAAGNGAAIITATSGQASGAAAVTVAQVVAAVTVTPGADTLVALGDTVRLAAEGRDANGHVVAEAGFAWASDRESVAAVSAAGVVTAAGNGAAIITATSGQASGAAAVTVAQVVAAVTVTPGADTLVALGDTVRLAAEGRDANGHVVAGAGFAWASSDEAVARVDAAGLVTTVGAGEVEVTASSSGVAGRAELLVEAPVAMTVTVAPAKLEFTALADTMRLAAEVRDQIRRVMEDEPVAWTSGDTMSVTVDAAGLVTAAGNGSATITATADEASGRAQATVRQSVVSVAVSPPARTIAPGDTLRFAAEAFDRNGHRVEGADFSWSSSESAVATVYRSGVVRGVAEGRATITATADNVQGTAELTVANPDRAGLVALYEATDGPNWINNEGWLSDAPLDEWYGVGTDGYGRVFSLDLQGRWDQEQREWTPHGLQGTIPAELGGLTSLRYLRLNNNALTGGIPPELGNLVELRSLNLGSNALSGPIPVELAGLARLEILQLYHNELTGSIPAELGGLAALHSLSLGRNELSGSIPAELGSLSNLAWLDVGNNGLTGPIPAELGGLAGLRSLALHGNALSGSIPAELGSLPNLETLYLGWNALSGPLPRSLLQLGNLTLLNFGSNDGVCAPGTAEFATWLEEIERSDGPFCNESDRETLELIFETSGGDGWTRSDGWHTTPVLGEWHGVEADSLGRVAKLDLSRNGLEGELTSAIGNLTGMTGLRLGGNALSGRLPISLTNLALVEFHYDDTELCAPIDESFRKWLRSIASHQGTGLECLTVRGVLRTFYEATDGPNWVNSDGWLTDAPLDQWYGVSIDEFGRVVGLNLQGRWDRERSVWVRHGLQGTIPPELGGLTHLSDLRLNNNALTGPIPPELGSLTNLSYLMLNNNALTGSIPPELGSLTNLSYLMLNNNALTGSIPAELGDLAALRSLSLGSNELSGSIPAELGSLSNLGWLDVGNNGLTGSIPAELGGLAGLRSLALHGNALSGSIPVELGNLPNLESLYLGWNALSGPLPRSLLQLGNLTLLNFGSNDGVCAPGTAEFATWLEEIERSDGPFCNESDRETLELIFETSGGDGWTRSDGWHTTHVLEEWHGVEADSLGRVARLDLSRNGLEGELTPAIGNLTAMTGLRLGGNALSGRLPLSLANLALVEFHYDDTELCAPTDEAFRAWLNSIASHRGTGLECLSMRGVLRTLYEATDGPNWVNSDGWLTDAPLDQWYGVSIDDFGRVVGLNLQGRWNPELGVWTPHGLRGSLPPELWSLTDLSYLVLNNNALTGIIPAEVGNLVDLRHLRLDYNALTGSIPAELGSLSNLEILNLYGNELTGSIPTELTNLTALRSLSLAGNELTGSIPAGLGGLATLTFLALHNNALTGPIPAELGGLTALRSLWLAGNELTGSIPAELGGLATLRTLAVDGNALSGPIPAELGSLSNLETLSLGQNELTGPIPRSFLQLVNLRSLHFQLNDGLCAPGTARFVTWIEGFERSQGPFCNEADMEALELLFKTARGNGWTRSDGWLETRALEEWHGVTADTLGRVTALDLGDNELTGKLPGWPRGTLAHMTELRIGENADLAGRLPLSLADLPLRVLHYAGTGVCAPTDEAFARWLNSIPSHEGTGLECAPLSDREILEIVYAATGGADWTNSRNWLTSRPLREWHGVGVDDRGRVVGLNLFANGLNGTIPPELGKLSELRRLVLARNYGRLTGPIPAELGNLANLVNMSLFSNALEGTIPPELGSLPSLQSLYLFSNNLEGVIPPELADLASLRDLLLHDNDLEGAIPPGLGNLADLRTLFLSGNRLTGSIPAALGRLGKMRNLSLVRNSLTGALPTELGRLGELEYLYVGHNRLTGPVPREIGGLGELRRLALSGNSEMSGTLPSSLTDLGSLEVLEASGTRLCAPSDPRFLEWLDRLPNARVAPCGGEPALAYLVQPVQSREFPVPLVAGEEALLRVFVTAAEDNEERLPPVRASFHLGGALVHVADIAGKAGPIPTDVDEGSLASSANALIPGRVVRPGLEMVIEIDPEGTLDPGLGVATRIPETGRMPVEVNEVPFFDLTVIPFLWRSDPDSAILEHTQGMAADPEGHELLELARILLPIGGLDVTAHEPVFISSNDAYAIIRETRAIRRLEGGTGYYKGMMSGSVTGVRGLGAVGEPVSFSTPLSGVIAHELGHNMRLSHAPCGGAEGPDQAFPYLDGATGAWGYDARGGGRLLGPEEKDLMSYCRPQWISDFHFTEALDFRLNIEEDVTGAAASGPVNSLLLWGGTDSTGTPALEPAFVVDAPPALPASGGDHLITGRDGAGSELFSLSFAMPEQPDGNGSSSFAFVLPVRPEWAGELSSITLAGPGGSVTLDAESERPTAILRNPRTGQVRGFLRDLPTPTQAAMELAGQVAGPGLEVLFSRGIPGAEAWRR